MEQDKQKSIVFPAIAIVVFTLLVFSAAYAYFNGNNSLNAANYEFEMPRTTSLICSKTDCNTNVTSLMMEETNTSSTTPKASSTCSLNCTCSGSQGATCNYNVTLLETGTMYTPSANLGTNNEFTVVVTSPLGAGCVAQNSSGSGPVQVNTLAGKTVSTCNLTVPASGSVSANVTAIFKWYNLNLDQSFSAGRDFKYELTSGNKMILYGSSEGGDETFGKVGDILTYDSNHNYYVNPNYNGHLYTTPYSGYAPEAYAKVIVNNNVIEDLFACVTIHRPGTLNQDVREYCLRGGDSSYYGSYTGISSSSVTSVANPTGNIKVINAFQHIKDQNVSINCHYQATSSACNMYDYPSISLYASSDGRVSLGYVEEYCDISTVGVVHCHYEDEDPDAS